MPDDFEVWIDTEDDGKRIYLTASHGQLATSIRLKDPEVEIPVIMDVLQKFLNERKKEA